MTELLSWQKECLSAWEAAHFHGIVNVITGAGKTVFAMAAMDLLRRRLEQAMPSPGQSPEPAPADMTARRAPRLSELSPDQADSSLPAGPAQEHISVPDPSSGARPALRVKIVVPTLALAAQWKTALHDFFPAQWFGREAIGLYCGDKKDSPQRLVMIYVINSARHALSDHILRDFQDQAHVLLIADECHRYTGRDNRLIFDFTKHPYPQQLYHSIGLSATPACAAYEEVLVPALGHEIYHYGFDQAVKEGNVSEFAVFQIGLSFSAPELRKYAELTDHLAFLHIRLLKAYPSLAGSNKMSFFAQLRRLSEAEGGEGPASSFLNLSYMRSAISQTAAARTACAARLLELLDPSSSVLVFCERISQAQALYAELSARHFSRVGIYHSQMDKKLRKAILAQFHEGEIRILISCRALDEGIDVPDASTGIVLSSTSVNRQRVQRLGRILRKSSSKSMASLYYLYIRQSSDDNIYLADEQNIAAIDLSYIAPENAFINDAYTGYGTALLRQISRDGTALPERGEEEVRLCLEEGLVRGDWLLSPARIDQMKKEASGRHQKNYWIIMKRLALLREQSGR